MKKRIGYVIIGVLCVAFTFSVIGFTAQKKEVTLLYRTGAIEHTGYNKNKDAYMKENPDVKINLIELGRSGYFGAVATKLLGGSTAFDLVHFMSTQIPKYAEAGVLEPLNKYIDNPALTDLEELDLDDILGLSCVEYKGKIYGLPNYIDVYSLLYRTDLISSPPETYEEYFELAKKFTKSINPNSPTTYGAAWTFVPPEFPPKVFLTMMRSFGGWAVNQEGVVGVNNPGAIEAGNWLLKFKQSKAIPVDIMTWDYDACFRSFCNGEIAMVGPLPICMAGEAQARKEGLFSDVIKAAQPPGVRWADGRIYRSSISYGWTIQMNASSLHKEEAWKFLKFATGKEGCIRYLEAAGIHPPRLSAVKKLGEEIGEENYFKIAIEILQASRPEPKVTWYPEYNEIMNSAIADFMTETKTPTEAMNWAAREIQKLMED